MFVCSRCPPGSSQGSPGFVACPRCPQGTFSEGGASACTACPSGSFSDLPGSESCTLCPKGQYQNNTGRTACNDCERRTYQDEVGSRSCKSCPGANMETSRKASSDILDCQCPEDHYLQTCPEDTPLDGECRRKPCELCHKQGVRCKGFGEAPEIMQKFMLHPDSVRGSDYRHVDLPGQMAVPRDLLMYRCKGSQECPGGTPVVGSGMYCCRVGAYMAQKRLTYTRLERASEPVLSELVLRVVAEFLACCYPISS